jgi:hypothetical protein
MLRLNMLSVVRLSVVFFYAECHNTWCSYAKCHRTLIKPFWYKLQF